MTASCFGVSGTNGNRQLDPRHAPPRPLLPGSLPAVRPPRPHLHVYRLFQRQAHGMSPVRAQHRAKRAHAAPAAATEELGHAVVVLRTAQAIRVLRLHMARPLRCSARPGCIRHSTPLPQFGAAAVQEELWWENETSSVGRDGAGQPSYGMKGSQCTAVRGQWLHHHPLDKQGALLHHVLLQFLISAEGSGLV